MLNWTIFLAHCVLLYGKRFEDNLWVDATKLLVGSVQSWLCTR